MTTKRLTPVAFALLFSFAWPFVASGSSKSKPQRYSIFPSVVTLYRVPVCGNVDCKPPPFQSLPPGYYDPNWPLRHQHFSGVAGIYTGSSGSPPGGGWEIWFSFKGCPRTKQGAFRLTLYKGPDGGADRTGPTTVHQVTIWSKTLVDLKTQDAAVYEFKSVRGTEYLPHIDIPSPRGCKDWNFGNTTN